MISILKKEENYTVSEWSGGKTKELAIYPPDCRYADRDFIFRLSSATVELDESDFTSLPDYNRVLMVLRGSVVLTYDGKKTVRLNELEQDSFDGASVTKSFGRITDYNLMVRKGCDGKVDILRPSMDASKAENTLETEHGRRIHALYCKEGYCIVNAGGEQKMISPGQLFMMDFGAEEPEYSVMGDGVVIRAQIGHDCDIPAFDENAPEEKKASAETAAETFDEASADTYADTFAYAASYENIPEQEGRKWPFRRPVKRESVTLSDESKLDYKGGFAEDFKWSFILANTQFRGAKAIFRKLNNYVYDDELHKRINKLEGLFVTFFVFIIVLVLFLTLAMRDGEMDEGKVLLVMLVWFVIDSLVVSPLIYYAAMPKPIKSHIHDANRMTSEEADAVASVRNKNERIERILYKYSNSGRNVGPVIVEKTRREKELDE